MGQVVNMHERASQIRRAEILADVLTESSCTAAVVMFIDEDGWQAACDIASARLGRPFNMPSDATRTLVWHRLTLREQLADADALEGLPQ